MTIARYLSNFANLLSSKGKVVNSGVADKSIKRDKLALETVGNFKNRIINGDMRIAQRGTSVAVVINGTYTIDRFSLHLNLTAATELNYITGI